jgi:hypothetical protein
LSELPTTSLALHQIFSFLMTGKTMLKLHDSMAAVESL